MARDPDDDALSWGDENDPTYVAAHPAALDEDDLEEDVPVVDPFRSAAPAPPLPPQTPVSAATTPAPDATMPVSDAKAPVPDKTTPVPDKTTPVPDARTAPAATVGGSDTRSGSVPFGKTPPRPSNAYPPVVDPAAPRAAAPQPAAAPGTGSRSAPRTAPAGTATDAATGPGGTATDAAPAQELADADADAADAQQLSSAALIAFGVIGGIFLLYTVGWLVTFIRNPTDPTSLAGIVQNTQGILAIAAPALWFIVTLVVAARRKVPVRIIWLAIGIVVLLPWPFLTGY